MMLNLKEKDTETIRTISQSLESVRQDVRAVSHELTPPKFQDASLDEILEDQLGTVLATKGMEFSFSKQGNDKQWKNLPTHIAYEVYRIIQELSSNIILHSEATKVDLVMKITNCELEFILKNNGKEFKSTHKSRQGIGLSTINERAKAIDAVISIDYINQLQTATFKVNWNK